MYNMPLHDVHCVSGVVWGNKCSSVLGVITLAFNRTQATRTIMYILDINKHDEHNKVRQT